MNKIETKKLALIRILQILKEYSDCNHPLTQEDIAQHLENKYGIVMERKAIGRNVSLLKEAGYDIYSCRAGTYLEDREFTDAELRILIDGVLSSKHISTKYSEDLMKKLCNLSSMYFNSHVKHICSVDEWDKTENKELFYTIEIVDEAIEAKKQIIFDYNKYGIDKKLHKTMKHTVSPYQLILHNQRYYLMAYNSHFENIIYYRLDRITDISLVDEKLVPITNVKGYENGINYKDFSTALPYMFTDSPKWVVFIADIAIVDQIIDWFGKDARINKFNDTEVRVSIRVSLLAMEHWAMQYAGYVKVISPKDLVDSIRDRLKGSLRDYGVR